MLAGRAFYESIGSPRHVVAPMVDQSEFAWRLLTRSFLPAEQRSSILTYTPMFHARLFAEDAKYRDRMFEPLKASIPSPPPRVGQEFQSDQLRLDGNPKFDRPLFVQFCANDPKYLLEAAKHVQPFCDAVDLNLGCPQGIAKKGHYGAFLQEDWDLIYRLINTLKNELAIPVTAKFRIQETKQKTLDYARMMLKAGASILTVHGRTREQKGHNTGVADWEMIRYLRDNLPSDTVMFANGNILQHGDLEDCLRATGVDGIMSAEGNLSDPAIFSSPPSVGQEGREYWRGRDGKGGYRLDAVVRRYFDILHEYALGHEAPARDPLFIVSDGYEVPQADGAFPTTSNGKRPHDVISNDIDEPQTSNKKAKQADRRKNKGKGSKTVSPNFAALQAHLFHMLRPLVSKHTDIRDALAHCRSGDMDAYENVLSMIERVVKQGLIDYDRGIDDGLFFKDTKKQIQVDQQTADAQDSSEAAVMRCKRPWWVCQPYVRPLPHEAIQKGAMTISKKDKAKLESNAKLETTLEGSSRTVPVNGQADARVEVPTDGLVCG